jgi:hypothetical protein
MKFAITEIVEFDYNKEILPSNLHLTKSKNYGIFYYESCLYKR